MNPIRSRSNIKIILIFGTIIATGIGVMFVFFGNDDESGSVENSSGFFIRENAIYVAEQSPSNTVSVSIVRLEKPGFAVVHDDINEAPGEILGTSNLIISGETADSLLITLSRSTLDGETIYVMLHFDNGDGIFDLTKDKPVIDPVTNEPITMIVVISQDAAEPDTVNFY
ncbi:MAG: hypothetical protein A3J47_03225 [Candidatus Yanofskybacteria bacterium RIFCSPHIGHO2_02_FULL_43_22]|uniref:DUF7282 domain-containing protein n=1 Tax=Candidatus Yanofskybacteria bacterium RIFCSPHIGHO2_02_FULL_43_22 TaxID=1802681 RepID=A0A1F8FMW1_9BACT|nr:MAG: hypothetical protein A3J47_03225 [Candidatus Yanofskybacteria bacterium RIFCSPHIGHO2_02_FULL_43_22]